MVGAAASQMAALNQLRNSTTQTSSFESEEKKRSAVQYRPLAKRRRPMHDDASNKSCLGKDGCDSTLVSDGNWCCSTDDVGGAQLIRTIETLRPNEVVVAPARSEEVVSKKERKFQSLLFTHCRGL